jgi:hypothetical protein
MIVHPRFVETYTYFGNNTLYLTPTADKGEMDVMLKVLQSDINELKKVRVGGDCGGVGWGVCVWVGGGGAGDCGAVCVRGGSGALWQCACWCDEEAGVCWRSCTPEGIHSLGLRDPWHGVLNLSTCNARAASSAVAGDEPAARPSLLHTQAHTAPPAACPQIRSNLAALRSELNGRAADLFMAMAALDWDYLGKVQVT